MRDIIQIECIPFPKTDYPDSSVSCGKNSHRTSFSNYEMLTNLSLPFWLMRGKECLHWEGPYSETEDQEKEAIHTYVCVCVCVCVCVFVYLYMYMLI